MDNIAVVLIFAIFLALGYLAFGVPTERARPTIIKTDGESLKIMLSNEQKNMFCSICTKKKNE